MQGKSVLEELLFRRGTYNIEIPQTELDKLKEIPDAKWDEFIECVLDEVFGNFEPGEQIANGEVIADEVDLDTLREIGASLGIDVNVLDPVISGYAHALLAHGYEGDE